MRYVTGSLAAAFVAVVSVIALSATPAYAAAWAFSPGGAISATNAGNVILSDVTTGANFTCNVSNSSGRARSTQGPSSKLLQLNTLTMDHNMWPSPDQCKSWNNIKATMTVGGLPYYLNAGGPPSAGVTTGTLTSDHVKGVHFSIHVSDGCDLIVGGSGSTRGTVPAKFDDNLDRLSALSGGNLQITTADAQCDPTLFAAGDTMKLAGIYQVSPPQNLIFTP